MTLSPAERRAVCGLGVEDQSQVIARFVQQLGELHRGLPVDDQRCRLGRGQDGAIARQREARIERNVGASGTQDREDCGVGGHGASRRSQRGDLQAAHRLPVALDQSFRPAAKTHRRSKLRRGTKPPDVQSAGRPLGRYSPSRYATGQSQARARRRSPSVKDGRGTRAQGLKARIVMHLTVFLPTNGGRNYLRSDVLVVSTGKLGNTASVSFGITAVPPTTEDGRRRRSPLDGKNPR